MNQVEKFGKVAEKRGWRALLFDVDDTVIPSHELLWVPAFVYFANNLARQSGRDKAETLSRLREINSEEFNNSAGGVHPSKYARMATRLAEEYGVDVTDAKELMKETVKMIYLKTPPLIPEAEVAMRLAKGAGMEVGLVTHSPKGRIDRMVRDWGWGGELAVFTESTLKRKGKEVWMRAVAGLGLLATQAVAVDDNLGSAMAAREVGIRDVVWLPPKWSEYAVGDTEGLIKIEQIGFLVQTLISRFE